MVHEKWCHVQLIIYTCRSRGGGGAVKVELYTIQRRLAAVEALQPPLACLPPLLTGQAKCETEGMKSNSPFLDHELSRLNKLYNTYVPHVYDLPW